MTKLKRDVAKFDHNEQPEIIPMTATSKEQSLSQEKFLQFATQMVEFEWQHALRKPQTTRPVETVSSLEELRHVMPLKASNSKATSDEGATVSRLNVKRRKITEE